MKKILSFLLLSLTAAQGWGATTIYVSATSGDDSKAGTTPAQAVKTIAAAISKTKSGTKASNSKILIEGGVYNESLTLQKGSTKFTYVLLEGSYVPGLTFDSRDLKNHRTVIKSTSSSSACLTVPGTYCKCFGIDFTGGSFGFAGGGGTRATSEANRQIYHHLLYQCVFSNNTYGVGNNGGKHINSCISCLIVNNVQGFCVTGTAAGNNAYCYNCTFVSNSDCAIYRSNAGATTCNAQNCLFVDNGTAVKHESAATTAYNLYRCLYWNNTEVFSSTVDWQQEKTAETAGGSLKFRAAPIFQNPQLASDFTLGAGSFAAKAGVDLSTTPEGGDAVTQDLYGTAWGSDYDIGCIKSSEASPIGTLLNDVYVSPSGDDANLDICSDAAHPVKTPSLAMMKVAANGRVHLANGTYTGMAPVPTDGVQVIGESRDGVILCESSTQPDATHRGFALGLFAHDTMVSNITFSTSSIGILTPDPASVNGKATIDGCVFKNNRVGIVENGSVSRTGSTSTDVLLVGHSIFQNNTYHGIAFCNCVRVSNCLFSENGYDGINGNTTNDSPPPVVYHCTFMDNGSYGYQETCDAAAKRTVSYVVNSLFYRNGKVLGTGAAVKASDAATVMRCCFWDNQNIEAATAGSSPTFVDKITTDPKINLTALKYGRIDEGSSCSKAGTNYVAGTYYTHPVDDLAYDTRPNANTLDVGCYISPETMADLIGHGYSYLTIASDPAEAQYGVPNLGYGKTLYKDGTVVSLSISGIDDLAPGVRGVSVSDVKRARYKGYTYKRDHKSTPEYESESAESLANVTVLSNTTWTLRWQYEYVVIASNNAPDCSVTLGSQTTPACSGDWVAVTNWIVEGSSYFVQFNGTSDCQFSSWEGNCPPELDTAVASQTILCSGSYAFYPMYKSIICVAKSGSDANAGTSAHPYLTIARGVSKAHAGDIVRIATGTYAESVTNTTISELTLQGGYTDDGTWTRDLKTSQTIITPPNNTLPCVYLSGNITSNVLQGLVLKAGRVGVYAGGLPGQTDASGWSFAQSVDCNHRLIQLTIRDCVNQGVVVPEAQKNGLRLVACRIVENGAGGISLAGDKSAPVYIHNCTIARNSGYGVRMNGDYSPIEIRNTIISENLGDYGAFFNTSNNVVLAGHNCIYHPQTNKRFCFGSQYLMAGNYFLDPGLYADESPVEELLRDSPAVGSPCIGTGEDLTDYSLYTEQEDLYGTAWDGRYDIGAIRSTAAVPTLSAAVAVTPEDDLQAKVLACAAGGTVTLSEGDFYGPVTVARPGVKIVGAGEKKTRLHAATPLLEEDVYGRYAVQLGAYGNTLSELTVMDGTNYCGVLLGMSPYVKCTAITNCVVSDNKHGIASFDYAAQGDSKLELMTSFALDGVWSTNYITRCSVVDNAENGLYSDVSAPGKVRVIGDNSLFARNGGSGVYMHVSNGGGTHEYSCFYYCTSADNVQYGFGVNSTGDSGCYQLYNTVVSCNGTGVTQSANDISIMGNSAIAGNTVDFEPGHAYTGVEVSCVTNVAPIFEARTGPHAYCPTKASCAYGLGRAITALDPVTEPLEDLYHNARSPELHRDAGCRTFPPYGSLIIFY